MKLKRVLTILLTLAMMFTLLPSGFSVYADVETADITSNEDWNDGETKRNVTISGNVTITVNGVVNIDGPITVKGNVTINNGTNGAGTLKRTSNTGNILIVENGAKLTLNSVVIDGDNIVVSGRDGEERKCSAIYVKGGEVESNAASLVKHKKTGEIYRGGVRGAAVYMAGGKFTMNGGTIADCEARSYGGAVFLDEYAEFIMNGGTVESNKTLDQTASFGGGAFYVREGTLKINYGTIRNNSSTKGGAIYNSSYGKTIITGGKITNNTTAGDEQKGKAIFHSCEYGKNAVLKIGGSANIDTNNDIHMMSDTAVDKFIELTSDVKNEILLTVENTSEDRVIATASDGVVLTKNDMAKIKLSNEGFYLKLEDNKIKLTKIKGEEDETKTVYLGYDVNGGDENSALAGDSKDVIVGEKAAFTISSVVPTRDNYDFLGWAAAKNATEAQYQPNDEIELSDSAVLYAVWKENTVPRKDNKFTKALAIENRTYGEDAKAPTAEAEYGKVEFTYSNAENGTYTDDVPTDAGTYYVKATVAQSAEYNKLVSDPVEFKIFPKTISKSIPLDAPVKNAVPQKDIETEEYTATVVWTPEIVGKFEYDTVYSAEITITPKKNYTLDGIAENSYELSGAEKVENAENSGIAKAEYPATGSKESTNRGGDSVSRYTVNFDTNGGSKVATQTVTRNSTAKEPSDPTKDGFEFTGWYSDKDLTTKYDFSKNVITSITLYAGWTEIGTDKPSVSSNEIILTIDDKSATVFGAEKTNDVAPKIVNGRTMLPARFVAENLGAKVEWDGENQLVTITGKNEKGEDVVILITIGAELAQVNRENVSESVKLDSPAFIENDRTYTPIRFISEKLGASVEWIEKEQKVVITKVK